MKERGILMHARSVQNILAGRKTQTRRIIKPQPDIIAHDGNPMRANKYMRCPYGQPGDRLWVRETWKRDGHDELVQYIRYKADGCAQGLQMWPPDFEQNRYDDDKWRPSLHMPRCYSRITLEITDVRVERVQDISDADIRAEGVLDVIEKDGEQFAINARPDWQRLWDDTNGKGAWDRNDWVWVVEFKVVTP